MTRLNQLTNKAMSSMETSGGREAAFKEARRATLVEKHGDTILNLTPEEQDELSGIDEELGGKILTTIDDNKKDIRRRALVSEAINREYKKPPQQ